MLEEICISTSIRLIQWQIDREKKISINSLLHARLDVRFPYRGKRRINKKTDEKH